MEKQLVNKDYRLERFAAKGGWTFAAIPELLQDKTAPFGWLKVRGSIDGYEIGKTHLMPMGKGRLFLPVKAAIRKQIGKKEGDWVRIVLYEDKTPLAIPPEFADCLSDEPEAEKRFHKLTEGRQKAILELVYTAKRETTRAGRIARIIKALLQDKQ